MKNSIRSRLLVATLGLAILPLIAIGVGFLWSSYNFQKNHAIEHQGEIAGHAGREIANYMSQHENNLYVAAQIQDLMHFEEHDLNVILSRLLSLQDVFVKLELLDVNGKVMGRASSPWIATQENLKDEATSEEFANAVQSVDTYYSPVYFDEQTAEPFMKMAVPIIDTHSGHVEGVLVSTIRLNAVWDLVANIEIGDTGFLYIVSSQGHVVAHRNPSVVLSGTNFDVPEKDGFHKGLDGDIVVLAQNSIPLGDQELAVVIERSLSEALNPTIRTVLAFAVMLIFALVATTFLGAMILRQIVRPVEALSTTAQAIATGDLSQRAQVESDDEIGNLATSFNKMAAELAGMLEMMEKKVNERTQELKNAQLATLSMMEDAEEARQKAEKINQELRSAQLATMNIMMDVEEARKKSEHIQKRYRRLFEESPIGLKEEDYSSVKGYLDSLEKEGIKDLSAYLDQNIAVVEKCSKLVKVLDVNQETLDLYAANDKSELLGHYDVIVPESLDAFREELKTFISGHNIYEHEFIQTRLDGEKLWVIVRISIAPGYEDTWGKVLVSTMDISELIKAQQAVMRERDFSDHIINSIPGIFYMIDDTGHFVRWNRNFSTISEYADAEISQMQPTDLFEGDDKEHIATRIQSVFTTGKADAEAEFTSKSGQRIPYYFTGYRMFREGTPILIGTGVDISERKLAQISLEQKANELARSNEELERFAYVASHDLQEPLRMVASYLQLLERRYADKLDTTAQEFIGFAVDGATRMKRLINDLLAYSRVNTKGRRIKEINLQKIVERVFVNLRPSIIESQAVITHDNLPTIHADETQILQVFQNLIANALKFRTNELPQIHIGADMRADQWQFYVSDNGIGIEPNFYERIFIIFQRLHTRQQYSGTGMGLAISKRIIEQHGGRIWVESEPGQGSTFYFTLPNHQPVAQTNLESTGENANG